MPDPIDPPITLERKQAIERALNEIWSHQTNGNAAWWLLDRESAIQTAHTFLLAWENSQQEVSQETLDRLAAGKAQRQPWHETGNPTADT